jgi:hypothetical protein
VLTDLSALDPEDHSSPLTSEQEQSLERFLMGDMPSTEAAAFQARLAADPALASAAVSEQSVIDGLRQVRVASLKARLDAIPTAGLVSTPATNWLAWVGGAVGTAIVASSIYFFLQPKPELATSTAIPTSVAQSESASAAQEALPQGSLPASSIPETVAELPETALVTSIPDVALPQEPTADNPGGYTSTASSSAPSSTSSTAEANKVTVKSDRTLSSTRQLRQTRVTGPADVAAPEAGQVPGEVSKGNLTSPSGKVIEQDEVKTKPAIEIMQADHLGYQYFDNKLFLYGSFGDALYELLELNSPHYGQRLYVFHKDLFYLVEPGTREHTNLAPIADATLIAELELLRKKRLD